MFTLDQAIHEWRRRMLAAGINTPALLDELESHLRDDVDAQISGGVPAQEAFVSGAARLGEAASLSGEFAKVGWSDAGRERLKKAFLTLAGIPGSHLETNMNVMNPNSLTEPRWATYTKAAVFLAPAIGLWTFCVVFLVPKLERIRQDTGYAVPRVYSVVGFIANHTLSICGVCLLLLALTEWRWRRWREIRRPFLGGLVFLLNATVLALITLMVIFALIAAPALTHRAF